MEQIQNDFITSITKLKNEINDIKNSNSNPSQKFMELKNFYCVTKTVEHIIKEVSDDILNLIIMVHQDHINTKNNDLIENKDDKSDKKTDKKKANIFIDNTQKILI